MTTVDPVGDTIGDAVAEAHRREWAFVLAATVRVTGDLDLAQECAQDAYLAALDSWARGGQVGVLGALLRQVQVAGDAH
ncbi:MAG TPA: hypothetical protein VHN80_24360, partial [Kineosporiaceae bacterium]|nr:hypothetical protein [Kineosporiaceae bacterium]